MLPLSILTLITSATPPKSRHNLTYTLPLTQSTIINALWGWMTYVWMYLKPPSCVSLSLPLTQEVFAGLHWAQKLFAQTLFSFIFVGFWGFAEQNESFTATLSAKWRYFILIALRNVRASIKTVNDCSINTFSTNCRTFLASIRMFSSYNEMSKMNVLGLLLWQRGY